MTAGAVTLRGGGPVGKNNVKLFSNVICVCSTGCNLNGGVAHATKKQIYESTKTDLNYKSNTNIIEEEEEEEGGGPAAKKATDNHQKRKHMIFESKFFPRALLMTSSSFQTVNKVNLKSFQQKHI